MSGVRAPIGNSALRYAANFSQTSPKRRRAPWRPDRRKHDDVSAASRCGKRELAQSDYSDPGDVDR